MSNDPAVPSKDDVIRITANEASSSHVDDLLRRQANLRGDTGITRDRRNRWWFQSWFLLMLAGMMAAFLAWAIIEPVFDDLVTVRGRINKIELFSEPTELLTKRNNGKDITLSLCGTMNVRGQEVVIGGNTRSLASNCSIELNRLQEGNIVEIYVEPVLNAEQTKLSWVTVFVDTAPNNSQPDSSLSLEQKQRRSHLAGMGLFSLVAGFIGLLIGATDGIVCRLWSRAALSGLVGLGIGLLGGFILGIVANLAYTPLTELAQGHEGNVAVGMSSMGFCLQVIGRTVAWGLVGIAMGLGQGIALRSSRLFFFGLIGGVVGGLFGGLLFDPIDLLILGTDKPSAHISRMIGLMVIGASVGGMIGLVERLARDAWLRMEEGPLAGKEFLVFKDVMKIGSSPRSDIYLFNDPGVLGNHAILRTVGETLEIESVDSLTQVRINDRPTKRARLRHGDRITLGRTVFIYQRRGG